MFYKIAKILSKTAIVFGFMCMYEALGLAVFAAGAYALEYFRMLEYRHRKRKIREAREHARREAA